MTRRFRNGITLSIWTQKCFCNCRLNFNFQNSQICPLNLLWVLGPKYGQNCGFLVVLTPQMVISDIVMTIGVEISQKKKMKNLTPVTILWFDPYAFFFCSSNISKVSFLALWRLKTASRGQTKPNHYHRSIPKLVLDTSWCHWSWKSEVPPLILRCPTSGLVMLG